MTTNYVELDVRPMLIAGGEPFGEIMAAVGALAPGEGLGLLRDVIITDTDEEAQRLWATGAAFCGAAWFAPFHFGDVLREPGRTDTPKLEEMLENGMLLVGTVDTVTRQLERLLRDTPAQWLFAWMYNGLIPHEANLRSIERFATQVLPRFGGIG